MSMRLKKLRKSLRDKKLDALILRVTESGQSTQPNNQNVLYLSGFGGSTAVLLVCAERGAYIIADARYYARALSESPDFELVKLARGQKIQEGINDALNRAGLTAESKLAFESHRLTHQTVEQWSTGDNRVKAELVPSSGLVEELRQYKDEDEIAALRKACRATSRVYKDILPLIEPGMKESELAFEIDTRLRLQGALDNSFSTIVASGANSAIPHHATGARKLRAGEPVVMDFGGVFPSGYCSDITRTIFVPGKEPSDRMKEIYKVVLAANKKARENLRPGLTYKEYDGIAREVIAEAGYASYFTHGLGHSLGLEAHDPFDYEKAPLGVGTVFTDEPGIYIEGEGGVRIEDDLLVTASGAERLTDAPYWKF